MNFAIFERLFIVNLTKFWLKKIASLKEFVVILIFAYGVVQIHLEDGIVHFFYPFRFFKRRYNVNLNDIESVEYTYYQAGSLIFNFKYGDKKQSYGFLFVSNLAIRNLLNGINARIGGQQ